MPFGPSRRRCSVDDRKVIPLVISPTGPDLFFNVVDHSDIVGHISQDIKLMPSMLVSLAIPNRPWAKIELTFDLGVGDCFELKVVNLDNGVSTLLALRYPKQSPVEVLISISTQTTKFPLST